MAASTASLGIGTAPPRKLPRGSLWTSRCGRKEASSSSIASGGAILTSTRPRRLRWTERATACRYIRGERVTSTRIMCSILPVSETDAALVGKNGPKCAECGLGPADGGLSKANFLELRLAAVQLRRIHLPRTRLNNGKKKAGPPFLGGGMRWPARPLNGIVIQASKLGEHSFHAVTRYSAVCAAHPQGPRTSENS